MVEPKVKFSVSKKMWWAAFFCLYLAAATLSYLASGNKSDYNPFLIIDHYGGSLSAGYEGRWMGAFGLALVIAFVSTLPLFFGWHSLKAFIITSILILVVITGGAILNPIFWAFGAALMPLYFFIPLPLALGMYLQKKFPSLGTVAKIGLSVVIVTLVLLFVAAFAFMAHAHSLFTTAKSNPESKTVTCEKLAEIAIRFPLWSEPQQNACKLSSLSGFEVKRESNHFYPGAFPIDQNLILRALPNRTRAFQSYQLYATASSRLLEFDVERLSSTTAVNGVLSITFTDLQKTSLEDPNAGIIGQLQLEYPSIGSKPEHYSIPLKGVVPGGQYRLEIRLEIESDQAAIVKVSNITTAE